MKFSACIEWLFADEAPAVEDRIRLAKAAGLDAIEFWHWSNKNLDAIEAALRDTGLGVAGVLAEPMLPLTDAANRPAFIAGLADSVAVAQRLGATTLIAQAGPALGDRSRTAQRVALIDCLAAAADVLSGTGIRFGLEPLNTLVDHKGYFLPSTVEALDIVDAVGRPEITIVYDIYHSAVMGERTEDVLAGRLDRVVHVHVADSPGRGAPGTGSLDLRPRLDWLFANGYAGRVGLEFHPTAPTSKTLPAALGRLAD